MPPSKTPVEVKEAEPVEGTAIERPEIPEAKIVAFSHEEYSGDIPHPRLMKAWNEVVPGSAEKIVDRFVAQSEHRINIEKRVIRANNFKQYAGPVLGFIVAMTTILGGMYCALHDHPFLGGSLSFAGLATLVGAFLVNTYWKPKDGAPRNHSRFANQELGRNDKCWCGSDKKFKNCHGKGR